VHDERGIDRAPHVEFDPRRARPDGGDERTDRVFPLCEMKSSVGNDVRHVGRLTLVICATVA